MNLYKKLTVLSLCFIAGLACNKNDINLSPLNVTEDAYFATEQQFTKAVYGVYAKLSDLYWYNAGNSVIPLTYLPGDDITITGQDEFEDFGSLQPSSGRIDYYYTHTYQIISRANILLEKIAAENGVYTTAGLKDNHKGEALFLRGLAFYNLWNVFGTAPVVLERVTSTDQFNAASSAGTQLLDQAIADFTDAAALLPIVWEESQRGRATQNAANGMLGKSLVFRASATKNQQDYVAAITAFNKITGVSLVADFGANTAADAENNSESLFEFQATQPYGGDNVWLDNDFNDAIGSTSAFWGFYSNSWALFGAAPHIATAKLLNAFDEGDPRLPLTLDAATLSISKYVTRDQLTQSGVASANNPRILRYADVLLLKAEAILQSGGNASEAIALINEVRTRARNMVSGGTVPASYTTTETNTSTVMDWIMHERLIELAGEGQRWFDLKRWHQQGVITLTNATFSAANPEAMGFDASTHLYFPVPLSETDKNPNVIQNPGY
ncbi:RagB/SusD family nutrient uptake outer membrane protein [Panacibacter sp. DH6]|uniref:RagB/SusD family nutrient uptake outer membrane protein n=1 Tax=Panacibacter microcysteis TaxID=2793269 RepID=A0A931E0V9_9BACT|nr:RagB/SusD family nutrient uptake outer membrane protein [Panacibacter microcysteis]MBG9375390.1 RagB/SusD family nutrient uptake outer membrane protein [Panacibacter microcysteis]